MYIMINGTRHSCKRRVAKGNSVKYLSVTPTAEDISGTISMYRDDGFLLSEDNADSYARRFMTGTLLTLTNEPEPAPVAAEPTAEQLLNVILGVNG